MTGMEELTKVAAEGLKRLIDQMGKITEGIGVQAERLWPKIMKAFWAQKLGILIVMVIIGAVIWHYDRKFMKSLWAFNPKGDEGFELAKFFGIIALTAIPIAYLICVMMWVPSTVAGLISPEGQFIIELVQKALEPKPK
jgi:hypothetical protein